MKLVLNLILIFANLHILRTNYHLKGHKYSVFVLFKHHTQKIQKKNLYGS